MFLPPPFHVTFSHTPTTHEPPHPQPTTEIPRARKPIVRKAVKATVTPTTTPCHQHGVRIMGQADTGANTTAGNNLSMIWNYRAYETPLPVECFAEQDKATHMYALGQGWLKMIDDQDQIALWPIIYTPQSTGIVLSPDHYATVHNNIALFSHEGNMRTNHGKLKFLDDKHNTITTLSLHRDSNGAWITTNEILMPPQHEKTPQESTRRCDNSPAVVRQMTLLGHTDDNITTVLDPMPLSDICRSCTFPNMPLIDILPDEVATIPRPNLMVINTTTSKHHQQDEQPPPNHHDQQHYATLYQNLELWHQRYGHISPHTLAKTSQSVEGIPPLPTATSLFHCPFCDMAKMTKYHGKGQSFREVFIPGHMFHMDLCFVSGPTNLTDATAGKAKPNGIMKSLQGHIGFLTIIDAATKYLWTFPIHSKTPPIQIIDKFLERHSVKKTTPGRAIITTTRDGYLARSKTYEKLLKEHGYGIDFTDYVSANEIDAVIRTDGGGELYKSAQLQHTVQRHQYRMESTAPDTSSQNGLAERVQRTIKERIRCLLYAARLGTEYWSHALRHVTWLYNRTYHSATDMTPLEAYTGKRPTVDKLITFGTRVIVKQPGARETALSHHTYDGIFVGYTETMDNIRYVDSHTLVEKTARHKMQDEFHYTQTPQERSPAASHLLNIFTRSDSTKLTSNHPPDKIVLAGDKSTHEQLPNDIAVQISATPLPYTAAAAKLTARIYKTATQRQELPQLIHDLNQMDLSINPEHYVTYEHIPLEATHIHPTLGLITTEHPELKDTVIFNKCAPGTTSHKYIRRWKSRLRGTILSKINDTHVRSDIDIMLAIKQAKQARKRVITVEFVTPYPIALSGEGIPTLQYDQLAVIATHLHELRQRTTTTTPQQQPTTITQKVHNINQITIPLSNKILRRKQLQTQDDWPLFRASEWKQLNRYLEMDMFGTPTTPPPQATILPWVWAYSYKESYKVDPTCNEVKRIIEPKARGTCNGGQRYGQAVTMAETYAACLEQTVHRLFWSIVASLNYIALGADVGNAFAEAPPPEHPFFMRVDDQFREWWTQHLGRPPIPHGHVIPIHKALQGHPEAPRLWSKHISQIIEQKMGFHPTTHEPCLYVKHTDDGKIFILRQVDDFTIAAPTKEEAETIRKELQGYVYNPLNDLGVVKKFNGVQIEQTRHYIKLHCQDYIEKIVQDHGWTPTTPAPQTPPLPMRADPTYMAALQQTPLPATEKDKTDLQHAMGFNYRQAIGEAIYAQTICRIDISLPIITLAQYSSNPAKIHYQALKHLFMYLYHRRMDGLIYWRTTPRMDLQEGPTPTPVSASLKPYPEAANSMELLGAADTTWASDRQHRRSMGGIVIMLAGAAIYWRVRLQPTVALSSTEAEFTNMTDAGKAAIYLRYILDELELTQSTPTQIIADNQGATRMAMAHQPTRRTRHVEMKHFAVLQWTEDEHIAFKDTPTSLNIADSLSKPTPRTTFYEHFDCLMGRRRPQYTHKQATPPNIKYLSFSTCRHLKSIPWHDIDTHMTTQWMIPTQHETQHHATTEPSVPTSVGG